MIMIFARLTDRRDVEAVRTALASLETTGPEARPEALQAELDAAAKEEIEANSVEGERDGMGLKGTWLREAKGTPREIAG